MSGVNLEIAEVSQGMNLEVSQTNQGIKLELAFGLTMTMADARYATQTALTTLTTRVTTAESDIDAIEAAMVTQCFKTFRVGQTTVSATLKNDEITLTTAGGIDITINAQQKKITFDTSTLKSMILDLQNAATTLAFAEIFSKDDQKKVEALDNKDSLNIETVYNGQQPLVNFTADNANTSLKLDIRKLESVLNTMQSTLNGIPAARTNAINQAIATEISNRNQAIATAGNLKQNITDSAFETTAKTVPTAVNELKGRIDSHDTALTLTTSAEITNILNS